MTTKKDGSISLYEMALFCLLTLDDLCGQTYSGATGEPSASVATSFAMSAGAMGRLSCSDRKT